MRQTTLTRMAVLAGIAVAQLVIGLAHAQSSAATVPMPAPQAPPSVYVTKAEIDKILSTKYPNVSADGGADAVKDAAAKSKQMQGAAKGHIGEMVASKAYGIEDMGKFKPVKSPTAPQNDLWSTKLNKGLQSKVLKNVDDYVPAMMKDNLAEYFAVPNDQVEDVQRLWKARADRALAAGNTAEANEAMRQMKRVVPLGKTTTWLDAQVALSGASPRAAAAGSRATGQAGRVAKAMVRHGAGVATVVAGGAIVGSAEACIALVRYASGDISAAELNVELTRAGVQAAVGTAVSAAVLLGTPAAPVVVVIALGVGASVAADYLLDELLADDAPSPELSAALGRPLPMMDLDSVLGSRSAGTEIMRRQSGERE